MFATNYDSIMRRRDIFNSHKIFAETYEQRVGVWVARISFEEPNARKERASSAAT